MPIKKLTYYVVKIISWIISAVLVVIILFFLIIYISNVAGFDVPKLGPLSMYVVLSDSMYPVFQTDDALIITKTDPSELEKGDIITFYAFDSDTVITHRIVDVAETDDGYEFGTKGDNNNVVDSFTTPGERVIGKYLFKLSRFAYYLNLTTERPYLIPFIVVFVVVVQLLLGVLEKLLKPEEAGLALESDGSEASPEESEGVTSNVDDEDSKEES